VLRLLPYVTLWAAFTLVYMFIPNTCVKLRSALVGGLVAALLWQTVGWGFARFVASSTQYYAIYSSFAILVLFLLWLYVGWVIVLLGAQVAYAHQHIHFYQGDREVLARSTAGREKLALHMMLLVGRNFYQGLDPMNVAALALELRIPGGLVKEFMALFAQAKLVMPLADEETFVLGRAPETITIKEILDCVRNAGRKVKSQADPDQAEKEINALLTDVEQAAAEALKDKNLQGLILSLGAAKTRR
jgi:membrane protein